MHPKIREPVRVWFWVFMTSALYLVYWIAMISKEINFAEKKEVFPVGIWGKVFTFWLLSYFLIFNAVEQEKLFAPIILMSIFFFIFIYRVMHSIVSYIKAKQVSANLDNVINPVYTFFYMFLWLAGIAYIQKHLNLVIEYERKNS